jgi:hypothetical protein
MKNKNSRLTKNQLQSRKNRRMNITRAQRQLAFVLLLVVPRIIKGKLGFSMRTNDDTFLTLSKAIHAAIVADAGGFYTPAFGGLSTLASQATAFEAAIANFLKGMLGGEAAKREAKQALKITLDAALAYINNLAFLDQPNAAEIITGAKMVLVAKPSFDKQDFAVKQGNATGEIILRSKAAKFNNKRVKGFYEWQYSLDGGVTWISLDSTVVAHTTATGMQVDVKTWFRKRSTTAKGGISAWSNAITITPV